MLFKIIHNSVTWAIIKLQNVFVMKHFFGEFMKMQSFEPKKSNDLMLEEPTQQEGWMEAL